MDSFVAGVEAKPFPESYKTEGYQVVPFLSDSLLDGFRVAIAEGFLGTGVQTFTIRVRANLPALPSRRQDWHSDVSILDGGEFSKVRIACWIPLTRVTEYNGTLEVVPGRRSCPIPHDPVSHIIREEDLEGQDRKMLECGLGSAAFLDSFLPHRAIPNLSRQVRLSVVVWMMV